MTEIKDLTFDEAMTQLEEKISLLEQKENANNQELYEEAVALKEYCADLLKKEKEEIKRIAEENNISLSDIGLTEDEEEEEEENEDEDSEEEEEEEEDSVR